ncbi:MULTISPECIES: hypothetical protein [unclassified Bacillus (in: firmicutes)]|uniref:hypothetical protein n=1 Tax=unclassified Bacillus (in: firmicutes) TaxID=185979 RepID=UPI00163B7E75|nr:MULTISPECIES: hypothetical protein [unclassified Bacillus (in: firmicutes)]QNH48729.1 hypothetical protein H7F25_04445 [Bacillus sp. PAMC28571]QNK43024.1 hypothetical protein H7F24_11010 [Bacillus sp. PAMC22265]
MMHVFKDEKLGVDREYVAVDRNAEVGETIVVTKAEYVEGEIYEIGHYGKVNITVGDGGVNADFNGFDNSFVDDDGKWFIGDGDCSEYRVLEPTDIVHIDGERYRLEDRKAEVGERVIYVNKENGKSDGIDTVVTSVGAGMVDVLEYKDDSGEDVCSICHGYYYVLTPVQDAAEAQESDIITVLANLGAEVAELKRTVARHQAEIDALHEDKVRLGEQIAKVAADIGGKTELSGAFIAEVIIALKKADL